MIKTINQMQIRDKIQGFIDDDFGTPAAERVCFIEIGPLDRYQKVHIPKAIQIDPAFSVEKLKTEASTHLSSQAAEIILYGEGAYRDQVSYASLVLNEAGYGNIFVYEGGKEDWLASGLWRETTWVLADHLS